MLSSSTSSKGEQRRAIRTHRIDPRRLCMMESTFLDSCLIPIHDISEVGVRILMKSQNLNMETGDVLEGNLKLSLGSSIQLRCKVVRKEKESVALEFLEVPSHVKQAIRSHFRFELLGASLRPSKDSVEGHRVFLSNHMGDFVDVIFSPGGDPQIFTAVFSQLKLEYSWDIDQGKLLLMRDSRRSKPLPIDREYLARVIDNIPSLTEPLRRSLLKIIEAA